MDEPNLQIEKLDKKNADNFEDCIPLPSLFKNPAYRVLISVRRNVKVQHTGAVLSGAGVGPNLVKSWFLQD